MALTPFSTISGKLMGDIGRCGINGHHFLPLFPCFPACHWSFLSKLSSYWLKFFSFEERRTQTSFLRPVCVVNCCITSETATRKVTSAPAVSIPSDRSYRGWQKMNKSEILYACSRCFTRHPFEELSQGQQLCKVRIIKIWKIFFAKVSSFS